MKSPNKFIAYTLASEVDDMKELDANEIAKLRVFIQDLEKQNRSLELEKVKAEAFLKGNSEALRGESMFIFWCVMVCVLIIGGFIGFALCAVLKFGGVA